MFCSEEIVFITIIVCYYRKWWLHTCYTKAHWVFLLPWFIQVINGLSGGVSVVPPSKLLVAIMSHRNLFWLSYMSWMSQESLSHYGVKPVQSGCRSEGQQNKHSLVSFSWTIPKLLLTIVRFTADLQNNEHTPYHTCGQRSEKKLTVKWSHVKTRREQKSSSEQ